MSEKRQSFLSAFITILLGVAIAIFILTFSIGLPIYVRPFYYIQIHTLNLVEETGFSYEVIRGAYDEVLNYLTLPFCEFGTGELLYSESGAAHFADCRWLFTLNLVALLVSTAVIVAIFVLRRRGAVQPAKPRGLSVGFWSATSLLSAFTVIVLLVLPNFDRAFSIFHRIFFPGKLNWLFDPRYDQIINIMPTEFFINCAIIIATSVILLSAGIIGYSLWQRKREERRNTHK